MQKSNTQKVIWCLSKYVDLIKFVFLLFSIKNPDNYLPLNVLFSTFIMVLLILTNLFLVCIESYPLLLSLFIGAWTRSVVIEIKPRVVSEVCVSIASMSRIEWWLVKSMWSINVPHSVDCSCNFVSEFYWAIFEPHRRSNSFRIYWTNYSTMRMKSRVQYWSLIAKLMMNSHLWLFCIHCNARHS